jgi:hypothetical protein
MDDCTLFSDTSKCCLNIFFALVSFLDFQHEIRAVRVYKAWLRVEKKIFS